MDVTTLLRVVVSLGVVFGAIWFISRRVRTRSLKNPRKTAAVQVLGRASVAGKASVVVVEVEGRHLVLGVTEHGVNVLHTGEPAVPEPAPDFSAVLGEAEKAAPLEALRGAVGLSSGAARANPASAVRASTAVQPERAPRPDPAAQDAPAKPTRDAAARVARAYALNAAADAPEREAPAPKARPAAFPKVGKPTWHPAERVSFRSALLSEVKGLINK